MVKASDETERKEARRIFAALEQHPVGEAREELTRDLLALVKRRAFPVLSRHRRHWWQDQDIVVNDVCAEIVRHMEKGLHVEEPLAYLHAALRNVDLNLHRERWKRPQNFTDLAVGSAHGDGENKWLQVADHRNDMSDEGDRLSSRTLAILSQAIDEVEERHKEGRTGRLIGPILRAYYLGAAKSYIKYAQALLPDTPEGSIKRIRYIGTGELCKVLVEQGHADLADLLRDKKHASYSRT